MEKGKEELIEQIDKNSLPAHIAIIMDGNGRWAKKRHLPRIKGHEEGARTVRRITGFCGELGIKVLTLFTFSTENWRRPNVEIRALMALLARSIKGETKNLNKNNVKLITSGNIIEFSSGLQKSLRQAISITMNNTGLILNLALNYGGRDDIVQACKKLTKEVIKGKKKINDINEQVFGEYLYTAGVPDPDLLIRTSGEFRISNFLLYQIAYSEIYVTSILWPDFREKNLVEAIIDFQKRERRFGRT